MAKKYFKKEVYNIPLYHGRMVIIFSNSRKKIRKYLPDFEEKGDEIYCHTDEAGYKNRYGYYIILNFKNKLNKIRFGCITHEVIHCTNLVLKKRGFIADFENDEAITYLAELLTNKVYKAMKKHGFKVK